MSMFWGLNMKPNRKYTQTIVKSFHISGAAIEEGNSAKLYLTADKNKYIVATLTKAKPQVALDLNFCMGDKIMFQTTGDAQVSLIGYLHDAGDSEDEDYDDEQYGDIVEALKREKAGGDAESGSEEEASEDEDMDDSKLAAEYSSLLEEGDSDDDEEDDEDDDDEEDDDEEEEDDSEEEDEAPQAKKAKVSEKPAKQQNGVAKQEKKQENKQQQQKSKKDKKAAAEPKKEQQQKDKAKEAAKPQSPVERTVSGGVKVLDVQGGNGPEAKQGKRVSVYYTGRLKSNNKTFDSMQKGNGFKFALGGGEVIKAWDVGVVGMKVGGKRRITCPPHMAYGARGQPPTIPPNSTLVFDVELKAVH